MQAIVHSRYGPPDGLKLNDIDQPVITDDAVLVRVARRCRRERRLADGARPALHRPPALRAIQTKAPRSRLRRGRPR